MIVRGTEKHQPWKTATDNSEMWVFKIAASPYSVSV